MGDRQGQGQNLPFDGHLALHSAGSHGGFRCRSLLYTSESHDCDHGQYSHCAGDVFSIHIEWSSLFSVAVRAQPPTVKWMSKPALLIYSCVSFVK